MRMKWVTLKCFMGLICYANMCTLLLMGGIWKYLLKDGANVFCL